MTQRLLYQVTLASGRILTHPESFGDPVDHAADEDYFRPVFAEDGRLLTVAADLARRQIEQQQQQ